MGNPMLTQLWGIPVYKEFLTGDEKRQVKTELGNYLTSKQESYFTVWKRYTVANPALTSLSNGNPITEAELERTRKIFIEHANRYVLAVNPTGKFSVTDSSFVNSWFSLIKPGGQHGVHHHHTPHIDVTGIYYHTAEVDAGDLRLYNPISAACAGTFLPRSYLHSECTPGEGLLILFPAFILHETAVSNTVGSRISFAFDLRLTVER